VTVPHISLASGKEFDLVRAMIARWGTAASGIGDDAAVLDLPPGERVVVSTDASVEGVHFRRDWLTATEIGYRATAAALSDLAAMAAAPRGLVVALGIPERWLPEVRRSQTDQRSREARDADRQGDVTRASSCRSPARSSAPRPTHRHTVLPGDLITSRAYSAAPRRRCVR
jgi:thiamine monophosphate kinase